MTTLQKTALVFAATMVIGAILLSPGEADKPGAHYSWYDVDPTGKGKKDPVVAAALRLTVQKIERLRARVSDFLGHDTHLKVTPHGGFDPPIEGFDDGYHRKSPTSQHHFGTALDVYTPAELSTQEFHDLARAQHKAEGGGLGLYPWGVHVDTRKSAYTWVEAATAEA